jgi:hypothetical protein
MVRVGELVQATAGTYRSRPAGVAPVICSARLRCLSGTSRAWATEARAHHVGLPNLRRHGEADDSGHEQAVLRDRDALSGRRWRAPLVLRRTAVDPFEAARLAVSWRGIFPVVPPDLAGRTNTSHLQEEKWWPMFPSCPSHSPFTHHPHANDGHGHRRGRRRLGRHHRHSADPAPNELPSDWRGPRCGL